MAMTVSGEYLDYSPGRGERKSSHAWNTVCPGCQGALLFRNAAGQNNLMEPLVIQ